MIYSDIFTFYALIAALFLTLTHLEQKRESIESPLGVLLGYAACLLWPVLLAAVSVEIMVHNTNTRTNLN